MPKAQVSIEIVMATAIVLLLFFGIMIVAAQKILQSKPLIDESRRYAQCQKIAESILSARAADAIAEQTFAAEDEIRVEKNNIIIGNTSCYYFGFVEGQDSGITLARGAIKVRKAADGKIYVEQVV